jgi:hypothetical protein
VVVPSESSWVSLCCSLMYPLRLPGKNKSPARRRLVMVWCNRSSRIPFCICTGDTLTLVLHRRHVPRPHRSLKPWQHQALDSLCVIAHVTMLFPIHMYPRWTSKLGIVREKQLVE